jgi:hypothetical protein
VLVVTQIDALIDTCGQIQHALLTKVTLADIVSRHAEAHPFPEKGARTVGRVVESLVF